MHRSTGVVREFNLERWRLGSRNTPAVLVLGKVEGATLFMTLLAGFKTLLHHWARQDDIVVGTDIANRSHKEVEGLIGCFVNILVLRTNLAGNPSFRELLTRVREVTLGAYAHQDFPFEKIVDEVAVHRDADRIPVCQVLFVLQNAPRERLDLPGLTVTTVPVELPLTKFDLAVFIAKRDSELLINCHYDTDVLDDATVNTLLARYEALLNSVVENPVARLEDLNIITESEKHEEAVRRERYRTSALKSFRSVVPKPVAIDGEFVEKSYLTSDRRAPLVIRPLHDDVDLQYWAKQMRRCLSPSCCDVAQSYSAPLGLLRHLSSRLPLKLFVLHFSESMATCRAKK